MDFIERFFGLSPDNGDGSTELLWCVAIAAVLVAAFWFHQRRRRARQMFRRRD
jgi:cytochrome c-type biogenesis protein CcmH/NrfF